MRCMGGILLFGFRDSGYIHTIPRTYVRTQ